MKFLIVEDDVDLRAMLVMLIAANYDIEIEQAVDGQDAIEKLCSSGPFSLVICDYNMPRKNGGDVYIELRSKDKLTPFILLSSEADAFKKKFPAEANLNTLKKPMKENELTSRIESMLSQKLPPPTVNYQAVTIDILEKIVYPGVPLFLRLGPQQYIKVLNENAHFGKSEANRFCNKKITNLYVELMDIKILVSNFSKNIFAKINWDSIDTAEALDNLQADWSLILDVSKKFGWPESVEKLAKENIAKTLVLIKKSPNLKVVLERLALSKNSSLIAPHCYLLAILASAIVKELYGDSASTLKKVTFAALLHDMSLNDEMMEAKLMRLSSKNIELEINIQTNFEIFNHPIKAAEFVSSWSSCPPDVDKLILQHHEHFDGKGFPNKLDFQTIFPLSGVMIVAEDIIYQTFINKDLNPIEYMKSRESYYNQGEFKKVYAATLRVLESCT